ncbi:Sensor protein kinase WalK [Planktothrix tepida]|uniref:histidine kinase n=1 Tax=Planktothrix tepida PCC 9214 TaxID=671072 RepID=A0A1J1LI42_9CYAN|nr:PAS domain S-box protein [Planktothrix tepida]CAD5984752.1 Sensor protein kinase WalK [Planktothrix tepida]CUR32155.1 putative Histidine kinase [Planktothrix tepida PCC 9214]
MITLSPDLCATESSILTLLSISLDYLTDACVWLTKEARIQGYNTAFKELVLDCRENHSFEFNSLVDLSLNDCLPFTQNGKPISTSTYLNPEIEKGNHCPINYELQRGEELFFLRISGKVLNLQGQEIIILWIRKGLVVLGRNITEKKQAEEALKARESQYRDLVETANCIILRWDAKGNIKFLNNYGQNFFGFQLEEIIGQNVVGTIVPETETSGRDLQALMDDICHHRENYSLNENENSCKQGERAWVVWSNRPIFNAKGELIEILSVGTDATERRQAQDALKHSLSLQQATFESIQEGVLAVDNQGNIITYNRHFLEMWSIHPELFQEPNHYKRVQYLANQVKDSEIFFQQVKELYSQPEQDSYDLLELKDGRVFERYSCPQKLGQTIIGRVWCFRDITDQKRAEADLKASEEKFRRIVETAHDIIYLMNAEGILLYIAPNLLTLTGYFPHELEGQLFTLFIHPQDISKTFTVFQTVITSGKQEFDIEFRVKHQDGTWNWYSSNWSVSQDAQGDQLVVGVSRNINERRRLENEFISLVSHELRTPLTSLVGGLDLLASGQLGLLTEQGKNLLSIAINNTERLIRLVNNILDLERMKSGKISLQKVYCNLADLMIKAQEAMQVIADQSQIKFEVDPFDFYLWVDPDRIVQILTNLLSNAIKFSEPKQKVWMSAQVVKLKENGSQISYICLQVKDQGRGIPTDKLEIIFERFEQVDASDSRTKNGTGLGLAICRLMVEQHQGKIWAESHLGQGSIFYVMLPIC